MSKRFEHGALIAVVGLVFVLVMLVGLNPLNKQTSAPLAAPRLAVSVPAPAPVPPILETAASSEILTKATKVVADLVVGVVETFIPSLPRLAGVDTLTGVFYLDEDEKNYQERRLKTTVALSRTFKQLDYNLDRVRAGESGVPRLFLASLPGDLKDVRETGLRKSLFFKTVLPLVLQANEEILRDRRRLWNIHFHKSLGEKIVAADRLWLMMMAERYGVKSGSIKKLLNHVDIIPPSLALAQAAEESGWGTSRFVREGNAVFGQWTFSSTGSLVPRDRDEDKSHKVKAFSSLLDSVRAYARNLNTHGAYKQMRDIRSKLRQRGAPLDGLFMVDSMKRYSQRGEQYVKTIRVLIESNNLHRFDDARLRGSAPGSLI
ncbi:MAG: glucosaminidase domain-containing protein [Rhodospirillales bacterium]